MKTEGKLLLSPEDFKPSFREWTVEGVFNPAAVRLPSGKIILYVRIAESGPFHKTNLRSPVAISRRDYKVKFQNVPREEIRKRSGYIIYLKNSTCRLSTISHFRRVILNEDGFNIEKIEQRPFFTGRENDGDYGVEDPRIIKIGRKYYMTYVAVSENEGVSTSLAVSKDLMFWKRKGIIFRQQNKDVVIFPEKIYGRYVALHRPEGYFQFSEPTIWISHSPDLIHWGREKSIIGTRKDGWDSDRIGAGTAPIKTKKGWLVIYHGVKKEENKNVYSAGAVLLKLNDPSKIIARTPKNKPLFSPDESYEKKGFVDRVVFPEGVVCSKDKKDLLIYSGGADKFVSVKKISLKDVIDSLEPETS